MSIEVSTYLGAYVTIKPGPTGWEDFLDEHDYMYENDLLIADQCTREEGDPDILVCNFDGHLGDSPSGKPDSEEVARERFETRHAELLGKLKEMFGERMSIDYGFVETEF